MVKQKVRLGEKEHDLTIMNHITRRMMTEAAEYLQDGWKMQNDEQDKETNFIYQMDSVEDVLYQHRSRGNFDLNYAIQRFYNYQTSKQIEHIFCSYEGCVPESNVKNKEVDFWLFGEPFDLKVTSFPKSFGKTKDDFKSDREYRNEMIRWFYKNQSQGQRKENQNRIFLVCQHDDGKNSLNNQFLKMEFQEIDDLIGKYIAYHVKRKNEGKDPIFNTLNIEGKDLLADVLFIKNK